MDVFSYKDYRSFLSDWLEVAKKGRKTTASKLAEDIRVHPSLVSQVLKGGKDFTSEQWIELCEKIDLTSIEKEYLHFVFLKNRAGTPAAKNFYQGKVTELLAKRLQLKERMNEHRQLNDEDRAIFYSSWLYSAVRLFSGIGKGCTHETVADFFSIEKERAESILSFLLKTGLCRENNSLIGLGDQHVHVPSDSPFVVRHHTNWRLKAIQSMDQPHAKELHFTAPMSISEKDFHLIREKIVKLIQETVEVAKASEAENIATLNIDFFWPTQKEKTT